MLEDLARILPVDIMNAAGALRWLPRLLGWATTNLADDGPEGELIAQFEPLRFWKPCTHCLPTRASRAWPCSASSTCATERDAYRGHLVPSLPVPAS